MVFGTAHSLAKRGLNQVGLPSTVSGLVQASLLKAPPTLCAPIIVAGAAIKYASQDVPLLRHIDIARLPIVGQTFVKILIGIQSAESTIIAAQLAKSENELLHDVEEPVAAMSGALEAGEKDMARRVAETSFFEMFQTSKARSMAQHARADDGKSGASQSVRFDVDDEQQKERSMEEDMKASSLKKEALHKAISIGPAATEDASHNQAFTKAGGIEDLVGSMCADIIGSAHKGEDVGATA